ncbi:uncharacterized protein LAESUDRAFT_727581 [Laetiporus sulphureus 93-53]|uniref:Uncharacterized protein n=1 Tax=Laetiporus sulphureus 93-53 TaxID=1314785 RepID=A0A165DJ74_9APHY|nr:uncharacterized protein LAESUDRAFT_727581 [Laetiporus sulphureus 93-53]KZT05000.1 hypothetical protein LAESUDRAFT_727581 [Laetiporus sulphureus 93-53]
MSVTSSSSSRSMSPWRFSSGPSSRAPSPRVPSPPSPPSPLSPLRLPPPPTRELPPRHPVFYLEDNLAIFEVGATDTLWAQRLELVMPCELRRWTVPYSRSIVIS